MKRTILLLALLLVSASTLSAQQYSASHMRAANEFIEAAGLQAAALAGMELSLESQRRTNPDMADLEPLMREFFDRYAGWEQMRPRFARLYASHFTEAELREITRFYRTPTGAKLARAHSELTTAAGRIGEELVNDNMHHLQRMITDWFADRQ